MAARTRQTKINDSCREKIQTSQLINRLQNHVFTYDGQERYKEHYLDKSQVAAALGLLKKTLPDLCNMEMTGQNGGPLQITITKFSDANKPS